MRSANASRTAIFHIMTESGPSNISAAEIFAGKSVVLFGVPGAFTPSCHYLHLPSYHRGIRHLCAARHRHGRLHRGERRFRARCLGARRRAPRTRSCSSPTAMPNSPPPPAWASTRSSFGLGIRSRRYALWARDGIVQALNVEADPTRRRGVDRILMLKMFNSEWKRG